MPSPSIIYQRQNKLTRCQDPLEHLEMCSQSFRYFFLHIVVEALYGTEADKFEPSRGWELMTEYAVALLNGDIKRLAIALPPRNGKSQLFSSALPLFDWLTNPSSTYLSVSHHDDVLKKFHIDRKSIFSNADYQKCIDWKLVTNTTDTFNNNAAGHIVSMVMAYVVTGLGASTIVVDDPISAKDSTNIDHCDKIWNLFVSTLLSRLNDKKNGRILVVSQRLCDADVVGHVMDAGYTTLTLQALADEPQTLVYPLSGKVWKREIGDVLNPGLEPLEVLKEIRRMDERTWQAQYQQKPAPIPSGLFNGDKIGRYSGERVYNEVILSVDSAGKVNEKSHPWGFVVLGIFSNKGEICFDLLYCKSKKYEYPEGYQEILDIGKRYNVDRYMIEDKSTGIAIIPSLKKPDPERDKPALNVIEIIPAKSKIDRTLACTGFINTGRFNVPDINEMPFTEAFVNYMLYEILGFGSGARTDDLLDALCQAITYFSTKKVNIREKYGLPPK